MECIFPGLTSLELLRKIQENVQHRNIDPEKFEDRLNFMSMFNDIDWNKRKYEGECISRSEEIRDFARRVLQGHWTVLGPGEEEKW